MDCSMTPQQINNSETLQTKTTYTLQHDAIEHEINHIKLEDEDDFSSFDEDYLPINFLKEDIVIEEEPITLDYNKIKSEIEDSLSSDAREDTSFEESFIQPEDVASEVADPLAVINQDTQQGDIDPNEIYIKSEPIHSDYSDDLSSEDDQISSDERKTPRKARRVKHCVICDKEFLNLRSLKKHFKTSHGDVKTFVCPFCNKTFKHKSHFQEHKNIHTRIKDYECDICNKKFIRNSHLTRHLKLHTNGTEFDCPVCKKKFKRQDYLVHHLNRPNVHSKMDGFNCSICNQKFKHKGHWIEHEKTHSGVRDFKCAVCKKTFIRKRHLTRHEKLHSGVKEFQCSVCDKEFLYKDYLANHMKVHTNHVNNNKN